MYMSIADSRFCFTVFWSEAPSSHLGDPSASSAGARSLSRGDRVSEANERHFAGCLPFFRVGQGGVLEKQEAAAEEACDPCKFAGINKLA